MSFFQETWENVSSEVTRAFQRGADKFAEGRERAKTTVATGSSKRGPATARDSAADGGADGSGLAPVLAIAGEYWERGGALGFVFFFGSPSC
jgi:hypothetical protein